MAATLPDGVLELLHGRLRPAAGDWPVRLAVRLGEMRPAFLAKGRAGRGHRAVSRNGRVLLASDRPLAGLVGRVARLRMQTWHLRLLPGDPATVHGVLLYVEAADNADTLPAFDVRLCRSGQGNAELALDVGGRLMLAFRRLP